MAKNIKRYVVFTSHNSGGHSLDFFKTPKDVVDEIENSFNIKLSKSNIQSIENLNIGDDMWIEYPDSSWSTIFYEKIEL